MKVFKLKHHGLGVALALALAACTNPGVPLYQSTITGRAALQATTPLVAAGWVPPAVGADVDAAGSALYATLGAWNQARLSGNAPALAEASEAAGAALATLETKLANLQAAYVQSGNQKAAGLAARVNLKLPQLHADPPCTFAPGQKRNKKAISPEAIAAIIDIAVTELPVLVDWINSAFSTTSVSDAQIQSELDGMAADLGALEAALAGKP